MIWRAQESLNVNDIGGRIMDEEKRARVERYLEDIKTLDEQITAAAHAEDHANETRKFQANRIGALEFEKWVIMKNIERIEQGLPEIEWPHEGEPEDFTDYSH